ncbi:MAG: SIMPL domain-containing protein [Cyanobacteria bacterium J06639_14]
MKIRYKIMSLPLSLGVLIASFGVTVRPAIAQLLYPPASNEGAISVTGQGRASIPADVARIEILVTNRDPDEPYPPYEFSPDGIPIEPEPLPEPPPITRISLQGLVDALTSAGVPQSAIRVNIDVVDSQPYYYYGTGDSVVVNLEDPTRDRVNELVQVISDALEGQTPEQTIFVDRLYVDYAIAECSVIEQAAYGDAMADAQLRAEAIAEAMDVSLSETPSVAELPFLGRLLAPCNEEKDLVSALFYGSEPSFYDPEALAEVTVYRELMVTYSVD